MPESIPDLLTRLEQDHLLKGLDGEQRERLIAQVEFFFVNQECCGQYG
jgi:hypothetical protein